MHLDLNAVTALAVFLHLGTSLARVFLKDNTDRKKLDGIDAKIDTVAGAVATLAPAVPAQAPKTLPQVAADLAAVAQALAAAAAPAPGGTSHAGA